MARRMPNLPNQDSMGDPVPGEDIWLEAQSPRVGRVAVREGTQPLSAGADTSDKHQTVHVC